MQVILVFYLQWFDWNEELTDILDHVYQNVTQYVPPNCYFCSTIPQLTYKEVFHNSVGVKSIPLEYVHVPVDYYIPTWTWETSIKNPKALPMLYQESINAALLPGEESVNFVSESNVDEDTAASDTDQAPISGTTAIRYSIGLYSLLSLFGMIAW